MKNRKGLGLDEKLKERTCFSLPGSIHANTYSVLCRVLIAMLIVSMIYLPTQSQAAEARYFYRVKRGDNFSTILYDLGLRPVYGTRGTLQLGLKLNPRKILRDGDQIYPAEIIYLPATNIERLAEFAVIHASGEVFPFSTPKKIQSSVCSVPALTTVKKIRRGVAHDETAATGEGVSFEAEPAFSVASSSVEENFEEDLHFFASLGYGSSVMLFRQTGGFGGIKGSAFSLSAVSAEAGFSSEDYSARLAISRYQLDFATLLNSTQNFSTQSFTNLSLIGGFRGLRIGLSTSQAPIMRFTGTHLEWSGLTILNAVLGYEFKTEWVGKKSFRKNHFSLLAEATLPFVASGQPGAFDADSVSGYGLRLRGRAKKQLNSSQSTRVFFGIMSLVDVGHVKTRGNWSGQSGELSRTLSEFQGLIDLSLEW